VYTLTPKRAQTFVNGTNYPVDDWKSGMTDVMTSGGATDWTVTPGASPLRSPQFQRNWKVLKVNKLFLREGQEHRHHIFLSPKYPFNGQMIDSGDVIWRNLSIVTMIVITGSLVADASDANLNVTTSSGALHAITTGAIRCRAVGKNRTIYTNYGVLDTSTTDASTYQKAIDDESHQQTGTTWIS
jgi:hypothetical protein